MNVRITKTDSRAVVPQYQTAGSAAFDLHVIEDAEIPPHGMAYLRTGLIFGIPEGHVMMIYGRSSLSRKMGLRLSNQTGILDADFRGPNDECLIGLWNPGEAPVTVAAGSRVAQAMILPIPRATFEEGPAEGPSRGGWGSTGGHGA